MQSLIDSHGLEKTLPARARLLQAAVHLLMRQSYSSLSVDDICKAAQAQKGTFYHHFESKNDLAMTALEFIWQEMQPKLAAILLSDQSALKKMQAYAGFAYDYHLRFFEEDGRVYGCALAAIRQENLAEETRLRALIRTFTDSKTAMLQQALRGFAHLQNADTEMLARHVHAISAGVMYQAALLNDPEIIKRDLFPAIARLLHIPSTQEK